MAKLNARPFLPAPAVLGLALALATTQLPAQSPVPQADVSAADWAARAREFQKKGSVFEALEAYEHAVSVDPTLVGIRLEFAGLLKTSGLWLRSADQYKKVLAAQPDHIEGLIGYGELLNAEYQFEAGRQNFARALRLEPGTHEKERALLGMGSAQFGLEDFAGASEAFETILKDRPNVMSALAFLAIAKRKQGDLEGSLQLWGRFLEAQPGAARAKIHRIELEELIAAIASARQAVSMEPSNAAAWANLGRLLRRKPDLPGAVEAFAAAARLAPGDASYRLLQGAVLRDRQLWEEAAASFAAAEHDAVYGTLALYNLAYCARRAGDRERESKAWARTVASHPRDIYAYGRYAISLKAIRGLDLEKARAEQAALDAGRDPLPFVRLAVLHEAAGDRGEARRAALAALRRDLNDVDAQRLLRGLLLLDKSATQAALKELHPARILSGTSATGPEDRDAARARGALLLVVGREREAEADLRVSLAADPGDSRVMVALASALRSAGKLDEAISHLRAATRIDPQYLYAHLDLALASFEANHLDEAISSAREAVRLDPDHPIGYSILGSSLREKGDLEKAARALELAVAIDPMDQKGAPRLLLARIYGALGRNEEARTILKGDLPEDPQEIYRLAWEFVRDNYHDRTYRGQDWRTWQHRFDGRLRTTSQALGAVALMLSSLDDRNTRLRSADQTSTLLFTQRTDAPEFSATGAALTTSKTVATRRLSDNVGYIAITNLDDPKMPAEVQKAVELMKTSDGVILDLRGNQGGGDSDVPRIAGMFVKPGTETGTILAPDGAVKSVAEPATSSGAPLIPPDKPIVVLVDRHTASSAENLAGSLKESRRAILVGEKTYGKSGIQLPKLLPGGAIVLVVSAEHADLRGAIYTGVGIKPDVAVEGAATGDRSADDPAVRKARELLKKSRPGS